MMDHILDLLDDYVDGRLTPMERRRVDRHLSVCAGCRRAHEALQGLVTDLGSLPHEVAPDADLWPGIAARLTPAGTTDRQAARAHNGTQTADKAPRPRRRLRWMGAAAVVTVLVLARIAWPPSWQVVSLDGAPLTDRGIVEDHASMRKGSRLVTDAASRARLRVGMIGRIEVMPQSRLRLLATGVADHRIALERGRIHAHIWAPPRLFVVETPSATAVDLGCTYELTVDSAGTSMLVVTQGYVELRRRGRITVVPEGASTLARAGMGPGTAFRTDASAELRDALERFDFEGGPLRDVLTAAGPGDALTLWQLLDRTTGTDRARVYDRLTTVTTPPPGTTPDGVLAGDDTMIDAWEKQIGLDGTTWWGYLKQKVLGE